jgi:DNA gyrase/topoisomerase IV subunit B
VRESRSSHEFLYEGGHRSFVQHLNKAKTPIHPEVIYLQARVTASTSRSQRSGMRA